MANEDDVALLLDVLGDEHGLPDTAQRLADHISVQQARIAALEAALRQAESRVEEMLAVEVIYWRGLTDLLIGAQQQSQSHADVIALAAAALTEASAIMPLDKRAALATQQPEQEG